MKTLALALLLCSTAASAQEDPVVLFGDPDLGQFDVSFLYDPTTNTATNLNTDYLPTATCPIGLPETWTYTAMLTGVNLSIGGTVTLAGCSSKLDWGGQVELFPGQLSIGNGGASFINTPAVPEPPMLLLCAIGMVGLWWSTRRGSHFATG
jgi:hypothetical protein